MYKRASFMVANIKNNNNDDKEKGGNNKLKKHRIIITTTIVRVCLSPKFIFFINVLIKAIFRD